MQARPSSRFFSFSFTIRSLLPPLTSNSADRIQRSVCAINPNNLELESLHVKFLFALSLRSMSFYSYSVQYLMRC